MEKIGVEEVGTKRGSRDIAPFRAGVEKFRSNCITEDLTRKLVPQHDDERHCAIDERLRGLGGMGVISMRSSSCALRHCSVYVRNTFFASYRSISACVQVSVVVRYSGRRLRPEFYAIGVYYVSYLYLRKVCATAAGRHAAKQ